MSRDLYLVTRIDVKRVAKLLRDITDRAVPLTHAQEAISRACGFDHWYHFNSVSKRREADETFQPLFYPEPENDELDDAAERLSEYLRERVDSGELSFSADWAREFLKKAWSGRGPSGTHAAKARGSSDKAPFADAVTSTKEGDYVHRRPEVDVLLAPEAPQVVAQAEGSGASVKPHMHRVAGQASNAGGGAVGSVDAHATDFRGPAAGGDFWVLTRDRRATPTVSYRRRRRLASEAPTEAMAPEASTEAVVPEARQEPLVPEAPMKAVAAEAPTEAIAPEAHQEAVVREAPMNAVAAETRTEATAPKKRKQSAAQKARKRAVASEVPVEAVVPAGHAEAVAPKAPKQAVPPKAPKQVVPPKARKQALAPEARKAAGAPDGRPEAVSRKARKQSLEPEALTGAVALKMPSEKPRSLKAATYREALAQLAAIDAQIAKLRANLPAVVEEIQRLMREYDLSIADIAVKPRHGRSVGTGPTQSKVALPPKYRDPKTGKTWSGRGRSPAWLGKRPKRFLIVNE